MISDINNSLGGLLAWATVCHRPGLLFG